MLMCTQLHSTLIFNSFSCTFTWASIDFQPLCCFFSNFFPFFISSFLSFFTQFNAFYPFFFLCFSSRTASGLFLFFASSPLHSAASFSGDGGQWLFRGFRWVFRVFQGRVFRSPRWVLQALILGVEKVTPSLSLSTTVCVGVVWDQNKWGRPFALFLPGKNRLTFGYETYL